MEQQVGFFIDESQPTGFNLLLQAIEIREGEENPEIKEQDEISDSREEEESDTAFTEVTIEDQLSHIKEEYATSSSEEDSFFNYSFLTSSDNETDESQLYSSSSQLKVEENNKNLIHHYLDQLENCIELHYLMRPGLLDSRSCKEVVAEMELILGTGETPEQAFPRYKLEEADDIKYKEFIPTVFGKDVIEEHPLCQIQSQYSFVQNEETCTTSESSDSIVVVMSEDIPEYSETYLINRDLNDWTGSIFVGQEEIIGEYSNEKSLNEFGEYFNNHINNSEVKNEPTDPVVVMTDDNPPLFHSRNISIRNIPSEKKSDSDDTFMTGLDVSFLLMSSNNDSEL